MSTFGSRLKALRKERKMIQDQVGEVIGVGGESISRYELDLTWPPVENLLQLAKFFGVSLNYLVEGDTVDVASAELSDVELLNLFLRSRHLPEKDLDVIKHLLSSFVQLRDQ